MNLIIKIINLLINLIIDFINLVIGVLPDSPFGHINFGFTKGYLAYINRLIPFNEILGLLGIAVTTYISYLAIAWLLRLLRVIS
jgi:hypothetical protein